MLRLAHAASVAGPMEPGSSAAASRGARGRDGLQRRLSFLTVVGVIGGRAHPTISDCPDPPPPVCCHPARNRHPSGFS